MSGPLLLELLHHQREMFRARSSIIPSGMFPPSQPSSLQQQSPPPPSQSQHSQALGGSAAAVGSSSSTLSSAPVSLRGTRNSQRALFVVGGTAGTIRSAASGLGRGTRLLALSSALVACGCVVVYFSSRSSSSSSGRGPRRTSDFFDVAIDPPQHPLLLLSRGNDKNGGQAVPQPSWLTPECQSAVDKLERANIRLVALDFDLTVVSVHTGGRWMGGADELARHVRPDFACYVAHSLDRGLRVSVATFSTQKDLISRVLQMTIPKDDRGRDRIIPVFGGDDYVPEFESGKQSQLVLSLQHFSQYGDPKEGGDGGDDEKEAANSIVPSQTLLVDDDVRNIEVARRDGYATLHYQPDGTRLFDADIVPARGASALAA